MRTVVSLRLSRVRRIVMSSTEALHVLAVVPGSASPISMLSAVAVKNNSRLAKRCVPFSVVFSTVVCA